jgi:PAS domain S-box-containing protein
VLRTGETAFRSRVLILAPVGRDAELLRSVLDRAGIASVACSSVETLLHHLRDSAGAAVVTEEALSGREISGLVDWIVKQPSWSDFPFVVLLERATVSAKPAGPEIEALQQAGNLTLLERPVGTATLVSAVQAAMRARSRQYEVDDALAALTASERRYRTLAEALPQLVWTSRPDGQRDYFSRQWVEYTGIPAEEQLGLAWIDKVIHPEDRERVRARWLAAMEGRGDYDLELRIRGADGHYRWFKARATPVRDDAGRIARWFGTSTDITEIVLARETLRHSREELERLVADRTRSLAEANDRLTAEVAERERTQEALRHSQKLETIGQLTAGVAHDFNNLLTAVLGNLEIMELQLADEELLSRLHSARAAAERGAELTHQLLAFSRKQHLAPKPLDLNRLVGDASDMLVRTLGPTVQVETVLTDGLWPALVDPTQIELVLLNLAINARDAMPDGGCLTIRTVNIGERDAPRDLSPRDYVLISVADTGIGMSKEVLARAIGPFFTTKETGKGSGLGLSMVHGVAIQSGGGLQIASRLGQGTTVSVYLPRASQASVVVDEAETRSPAAHRSATILLVDDDPDVRGVSSSYLASCGYRVLAAESGQAAMHILARTERIDLLLVDMAMPGINGIEVIRRARERRPGLRALLVTGYADIRAFSPADGDLVLHKPYRLEKLAETVVEALLREPPGSESNVVSLKPSHRGHKSRLTVSGGAAD